MIYNIILIVYLADDSNRIVKMQTIFFGLNAKKKIRYIIFNNNITTIINYTLNDHKLI
jgi:hypothetical protein